MTNVGRDVLLQHGLHAVDFKGEAITFKATTTGILATLSYCLELMGQREEQWRRRLEREVLARKDAEDRLRNLADNKEVNIFICTTIFTIFGYDRFGNGCFLFNI